MIISIVLGEYCLRFFEDCYTVTDSDDKLVFYYITSFDSEIDVRLSFFPNRVSYDLDLFPENELGDLISEIICTDDLSECMRCFILMFYLVKDRPNFKYYWPSQYIGHTDGRINMAEFRMYLKMHWDLHNNPDLYFSHNEPYSESSNKFRFSHLRAHVSKENISSEFEEIKRGIFECNIPNEKIAHAYINIYDSANKFYARKDANDIGYLVTTNNEIKLLFEIKNIANAKIKNILGS